MYVFSLITGFFFTFSNTTPTIAIFVSLLFDRAVSMVKHIMEIVQTLSGTLRLSYKLVIKPVATVLGVFH